MTQYIVRRIVSLVPVLFGLSVVLFAFIHLLPGDPGEAILGEHATPELMAQLRQQLGLDQPIDIQYLNWLSGLAHGDFGKSFINNRPVLDDFLLRFPSTIELGSSALLFASVLGVASRSLRCKA